MRDRRRRSATGLRLVAVLLALAALAATGAPLLLRGRADDLQNAQNKRQQVGNLINQLTGQLQSLHDREGQLRALITALDAQIDQTSQSISDAQTKLDAVTADLTAQQGQLRDARTRLDYDRKELSAEVVAIYKMGDDSTVDRLLTSGSFTQFWQRLIDLRRVAGGENTVVTLVDSEQKQIAGAVTRIAADQAEQQQVLSALQTQQAQLQQARSAREEAVAELQAAEASDQRQLQLAEQAKRELDQQIAQLQAAQAAAARRGGGNGHFVWPEQGPISQAFGCTTFPSEPYDPNCPSKHFHTGIDIAAAPGTPVGAGDTGIAYTYVSDYGYGLHVIIVHGNGWVSVYGHLAGFAVSNGQPVARGQTIGFEGSTGNSSGPHLHFEVRLNDTPVDPLQYLS